MRFSVWKYAFLLLLCFFITCEPVNSQSIQHIRFNNIQKTEGLSNNTINGLVRDNLGFLWIATNDGLCRYDGPNQIAVFQSNVTTPNAKLASSNIRSIFEDSQNNLWIGTRLGGLTRYHQATNKWTTFQHNAEDSKSISNDEILTIMEDSQNRLWIGTENGLNLFDYSTETFTRFMVNEEDPYSLATQAVLDVFEDDRGWIWVGTWGGGLHLMMTDADKHSPSGKFRLFLPANNKSASNVWKIYQDRQKRYWIGTHGGGLFLMHLPKLASNNIKQQEWLPQFYGYFEEEANAHSLTSSTIQDILQDSKGQLWIATGHGLNCLSPELLPDPIDGWIANGHRPDLSFTRFFFDPKNESSLAGDNVMSILEDDQGLIWFGTTHGISQYNWYTNQFDIHTISSQSRKSPNAQNLYVDKKGNAWIATGKNGLIKYDIATRKEIKFEALFSNVLLDGHVISVCSQDDEWLYIATKLGVSAFNMQTNQYRKYPTPTWLRKAISNFYVQTIFIDTDNVIWLGTEEGLFSINPISGDYEAYERAQGNIYSISDNSINDIMEDSQGNLWIATFNGLNKVSSNQKDDFICKRFFFDKNQPENTLINNQVITLEEINGVLYIGTTTGLCSYDLSTNQFKTYSSHKSKSWIHSIEPTKDGNFWAGTTEGLFYFNTKTETTNFFEKVDGLDDLYFLLGSSGQDGDGYLYFGTRDGLTRFHPDRFAKNEIAPSVYLTSLKKVNAKGEQLLNGIYKKMLVLNHNDYYLSLNFAALNFNRGEKNQYAYKLEGFDDTWIYSDFGIPIVYTNLAPQTYTFKVKAANNDGIWNEEGVSLKIIKQPAFWETWWFLTICLLFLGSVIVTGFSLYTENIRTRNSTLKGYNDSLNKEIEERKKAEKALAYREKFTRLIMDNIPQFIYWVDKDYKFLGGNSTFQKIIGVDSEAALKEITLLNYDFPDEFKNEQYEILAEVMTTEKSIFNKISQLPSAPFVGQDRWVERNLIPLRNDEGKVMGMLVSGADITERIKREKLLKENAEKLKGYNKELKRSNQDLEQFAYIASHDLKEPLRIIGNFSGLLARTYKTKLDQDAFEYIDFIEDGVSRMSNLINSLLTYSRVGRKETSFRNIDLNKLVEVKLFDLSQLIKDRHAIINLAPLPTIFGEREQIGMVFYNLINNAIKFNKEAQPIITIKAEESPNDDCWQFSVSDNGIGIEPQYQQQIFEIFRRLHAKREYEGTFIGLSVCQKIVHRHAGKIWLKSTYGEGTTFYFTISKTLAETEEQPKSEIKLLATN